MIDLHIHTTASDGIYSPKEIVSKAKTMGLQTIAITDHDTVSGLKEAMQAAKLYQIEVIPGVEISTDFTDGLAHVLGYFIDYENKKFTACLEKMKIERQDRAQAILRKLQKLNINIAFEKVAEIAGDATIGRPHVAAAMVEMGFVPDMVTAFDLYLAEGRPAYADRLKITPREACQAIRQAGGIAVLAHPFTVRNYQALIANLRPFLSGIETYYGEFNEEQKKELLHFSCKYQLIPTGGSDFHGEDRAGAPLGVGGAPDYIVNLLKKASRGNR
ncbi:MAG: PHP domain-containing protein [Chloroflexi bacterium]|nr:PHP domain-containing protein [Chloroflexota bacterium]